MVAISKTAIDLRKNLVLGAFVFREILEKLNISKRKVKLFYNAVRLWHNLRY